MAVAMSSLSMHELRAHLALLLAEAIEPLHASMRSLHTMLESHMPAVETCCCVPGVPRLDMPAPFPTVTTVFGPAAGSPRLDAPTPLPRTPTLAGPAAVPVQSAAKTEASPLGTSTPEERSVWSRQAGELATSGAGSLQVPARQSRSSGGTVETAAEDELLRKLEEPGSVRSESAAFVEVIGRLQSENLGPVARKALAVAGWWEGLQEPRRESRLARFVKSDCFGWASSFFILINFGFVVWKSDYEMLHLGQDVPVAIRVVEWAMMAVLILEVLLRLAVHRLYFLVNADMAWNIFDLVVVLSAIATMLLEMMSRRIPSFTFMRSLRILKVVSILRAFRVFKAVRALAQILESFKRSANSLFWCLVTLAFLVCLFSLLFMSAVSGYLVDGGALLDEQSREEYMEKFGSLPNAWYTLFGTVSGGYEWSMVYELLLPTGRFFAVAFMGFIFFFMFALFNILTGIIVERAVAAAAPARAEQVLEVRRAMVEAKDEFKRICGILDLDHTGTLSLDELKQSMENPMMVAYLASAGIAINEVELFFSVIAGSSEVKEVDIDMFVRGCMTMKGQATALDMRQQLYYTTTLMKHVKNLETSCAEKMDLILDVTHRLLSPRPALQSNVRA
mmetsp:Transcript_100934/g.281172  ORF Transcript_100934/g.281172 Transcript_100934/m.281172 type:complete len:620 (-) Transcript_100934:185-2044(-)